MRYLLALLLIVVGVAVAAAAPLRIESLTWQGTGIPNNPALDEVHGQFVVRNVTAHAVAGVVMEVHIRNHAGETLTTLRKSIGTLAARQTASFDWSWRNYTLVAVRPEGEVVYHVHGGVASITGMPTASGAAPAAVTEKSPPLASPSANPPGYGAPNTAPEKPAPGYGTP